MRNIIVIFCLLLLGCVSRSPHELPEAYLYVDGKKYEMNSSTSCWDYKKISLCGDGPPITKKRPVVINGNSVLSLKFVSGSELSNGYFVPLEPRFFIKSEDIESPGIIFWESNEDLIDEQFESEERNRHKIEKSMEQNIPNEFNPGKYILEVGSWWEHGDVFHFIYVEKKP